MKYHNNNRGEVTWNPFLKNRKRRQTRYDFLGATTYNHTTIGCASFTKPSKGNIQRLEHFKYLPTSCLVDGNGEVIHSGEKTFFSWGRKRNKWCPIKVDGDYFDAEFVL